LTAKVVAAARIRAASGEKVSIMAIEYGVLPGVLRAAVAGINWKCVEVPPVTNLRKLRAALKAAREA
jgi:hypothetical protein